MREAFRPDIQALRAVAVLLVVAFHLWPTRLTGGYIGVDVFFVISGYLITAHLLREVDATGRIRLAAFYARRIRRLLPAALLVLAVTLVGVLLLTPTGVWRQVLPEIGASAVYVVNWLLAANAVDYFAAENSPSPVQHYWSLSAEEQFYIVWPLLILVAGAVAARLGRRRRVGIAVVLVLVTVAGFAYSVLGTAAAPRFTYFATPAHAWEFSLGGLVALAAGSRLLGRWTAAPHWLRTVAVAAGFGAILAAALRFDADTLFPGWVAIIPVLGALAVIATPLDPATVPARMLALRPVQFIGDTSYSLYLWHWPLIVLAPALLDRELRLTDRLVLLALSIALGWMTKRLVEDPVRDAPVLRRRQGLTFASAAVASALVLAGSVAPVAAIDARREAVTALVEQRVDSGDPCFGAASMRPGADCPDRHRVDPALGTDPLLYERQPWAGDLGDDCVDEPVRICTRGHSDPDAVIVIVGDSHLGHYWPALSSLLAEHRWQYRVISKVGCPAVVTSWQRSDPNDSEAAPACLRWRERMVEAVAAMDDVDLVITSDYTLKYRELEPAANRERLAGAFAETWRRWTATGARVLAIADNPLTNKQPVPECLAANGDRAEDCALPRAEAIGGDPIVQAAEATHDDGVALLDLSDRYCDAERCHVVIGGVVAYRDTHHISDAFSRSLTPDLERAVLDELARAGR